MLAFPQQMKLHPEEVERLVNEHYEKLYRFGLSLARNEAEAADLTQQTFFKLAAKGGRIRDRSKAKSWLFTTLYREFLALKRHSSRFVSVDSVAEGQSDTIPVETISVDTDAISRADAGIVLGALAEVREIYRAPLALFYIEDLGYREIAEVLDVPIGTVMSRLSRGKEELRRRLNAAVKLPHRDAENIIPLSRQSGA